MAYVPVGNPWQRNGERRIFHIYPEGGQGFLHECFFRIVDGDIEMPSTFSMSHTSIVGFWAKSSWAALCITNTKKIIIAFIFVYLKGLLSKIGYIVGGLLASKSHIYSYIEKMVALEARTPCYPPYRTHSSGKGILLGSMDDYLLACQEGHTQIQTVMGFTSSFIRPGSMGL